MILPEPVLSADDMKVAEEDISKHSSRISNPWSKYPTKLTVLRAMSTCLAQLDYDRWFGTDIVYALAQKSVCFLHFYSLEVERVHF